MSLLGHVQQLRPSTDHPYLYSVWAAGSYCLSIPIAISLLARDPGSIKFTPSLIKSFFPEYSPLREQTPWIVFKARQWLESYLKPNMFVFEYGSGGSTLFTSKRVGKLISIEHDRVWYEQVSSMLSKERISNCEYFLHEPKESANRTFVPKSWSDPISTKTDFTGMTFESYVKSIEDYPSRYFDLVVIDGRARLSCVHHAMSKIPSGGYLMFDDTHRAEYARARSLLSNYQRIDFFGAKPYNDCLAQTSIWKMKS